MGEINILLLSAGRRVELIQCFQKAAHRIGIKSKIIAADCSATAPALYFANKAYIVPSIHEPDYINSIIDISNREKVALIVPTIDTELMLLAENKQLIEENTGAKVLVSDLKVVRICRDKLNTQRFLEEKGFGAPKMYDDEDILKGNLPYPLFIKPRFGSSSINTYKVNSWAELNVYRNIVDQPIVQDFVEGQEYTVDVFLDFNSKVITVVPRLRLATRSGEISKGKIVKERDIINDVSRLMHELKPIGHITVQLMKTENGIKYLEINPRFGGGAPMSIISGADSCENLYRLMLGESLEYNENYRENLTFLRFDSCICLDENMELVKW